MADGPPGPCWSFVFIRGSRGRKSSRGRWRQRKGEEDKHESWTGFRFARTLKVLENYSRCKLYPTQILKCLKEQTQKDLQDKIFHVVKQRKRHRPKALFRSDWSPWKMGKGSLKSPSKNGANPGWKMSRWRKEEEEEEDNGENKN